MSGLRLPKISRAILPRDVSGACGTAPTSDTMSPSDASTSVAGTPAPQNSSTGVSPPSVPLAGPSTSEKTSKFKWKHLKEFARVSNPVGPLKAFADVLVECTYIYESVSENQEEFAVLQAGLETLFEELIKHLTPDAPPVMTESIKNICCSIQVELVHIQGKQDRNKFRRAVEIAEDSKEVLVCYRRIQVLVHRLLLNVNLSAWKGIDKLVAETRLAKLSFLPSPRYDSGYALKLGRGGCTPGTRIDVLDHISQWIDNPYSESIYWLNGIAGAGKTAIAYSVCTQLCAKGRLAASFFCSRSFRKCRDVCRILPSIAYQLARFSRPFQFELLRALEENPDAQGTLPDIQFEKLISQPLERARDPWPSNSIIVIDALDECEDKTGVGLILDILLTKSRNLPMKFFVSSRPESIIHDSMSEPVGVAKLVLHELDKITVQGDIDKYLREALAPINPSNQQIATLVERAGVQFIHAATIVRLIRCGKSGQSLGQLRRLDTILGVLRISRNEPNKIDDIGAAILKAIREDPTLDETKKDDVKLVLRVLICVHESLTIPTLPEVFQFDNEDRVDSALDYLLSKICMVESNMLIMYLSTDPVHDYPLTSHPLIAYPHPLQITMSNTQEAASLSSGLVVSNLQPPQSTVLTSFPGNTGTVYPLATPQVSVEQVDEFPYGIHFPNNFSSHYAPISPSYDMVQRQRPATSTGSSDQSHRNPPLTSGQASLYYALLSLAGSAPGCASPKSESNHDKDEVDGYDDLEGVQQAMCMTVTPDANVESNALPFVLQSYAQWVNFMVFDPKNVVHVIREGVIAQFTSSQETRTRVVLLSNVFGALGKSPVLNSKVRSVVTYLSAEAHQSIVRFTSTEPAPLREMDMMSALKSIDLMMEVILLRRFGGSISTIVGLMEAASPVFRRACPEPLEQLVNLPNILLSPSINLRYYAETDIMTATLLARRMFLRYNILYTPEINEQFTGPQAGLHWLHGIPDQLIILLAWINMLHEDFGTNVDPLLVSQIEMEVGRVKITPSTSDDPVYTIRRYAVQECWRFVVYIHLYVTLCGAHAEDPRVVKFVKRFTRFLGEIKPARAVDTFLSLPIMFIGTFVSRKQDRDLLFRRLATMQECTMPGRAAHDNLMVLCDIWKRTEQEQRPARWTDLRISCQTIAGV